MASRAPVDVFRFRDYRGFLRAYRDARKARGDGFSLRGFSRRIGLGSPNYFKLVMDGERNLTSEMAQRFAEGCGLSGESAEFFCELVAFNQAQGAVERDRHYARLQAHGRYRKVHRLDAKQDAYHAHWYMPAIRELVLRSDFDEEPRWIAETLMPRITAREAARGLSALFDLGLLGRNVRGRPVQTEPLLETSEGPLGHHIVKYHRTMLAHAAHALDSVPREEREIVALTLCVSESRMAELKSELERFRASLLERYGADDDAERVVQINLQMFPMSEKRP